MQRCPRCQEEIRLRATRCRFCSSDLGDRSRAALITSWIRSHSTLSLSLVTFLFVVFQIYKASGFEVNSTVELLRAAGLSTIVVGVLLVLLPMELVLLTMAGCWWLLAARDATSTDPPGGSRFELDARSTPLLVIVVVLVLGLWTNPWPFWLGTMLIALWTIRVAYRYRRPADRGLKWLRRVIASVTLVFGFFLLQRPTIWVSAEVLEIADGTTIVAYVIADDGRWLSLLTPDHRLLRQDAEEVVARDFCAVEYVEARLFDRALRLRPVQVLGAISAGEMPLSLTPPCP